MKKKNKSIKPSCHAVKPDGIRCQAAALPQSEYCFFHDPTRAAERHAARSFGGTQNRMRTLPSDAPDIKIADCRDVVELISETINGVRKGQIDPRIGNSIGYLATVLIKAIEPGELEGRLAELEALVKRRETAWPDLKMTG